MDDALLKRLRCFHTDYFPKYRQQYEQLVQDGQHPTTLFIGCSDSRLLPHALTGAGPGELF
jgi:carbonic anhydrase